ncbi:hypothetical protein [Okeania sp. SIO2B9]|uniref:hypothetical protein n=1 Tax=Okeania sp. SIO2B9 TaxID=2607782 RepID=UPI00142D0829|nr:hypothetical protein [Okeania sp. SIO2B9]NES87781.1 hypothetical protein [Okeania sp. SIO2B9]
MAIFKDDHEHGHQHIYGGVGPDASKWFGEGFESQKIKEGTYIIKFECPFDGIPAPVCTITGNEWNGMLRKEPFLARATYFPCPY